MKKITNYILLLSLFFCLNSVAQKSEPVSNKTSFWGKRHLKKEKRVQHASNNVAKSNEHRARKKNKLGTTQPHKANKKAQPKEKHKVKRDEEKIKG